MTIPNVNVASSEFKADPYPYYKLLRAEAPVHTVTLPDKQTAWLLTRYDDVSAMLKDERFVKNKAVAEASQFGNQAWMPGFIKVVSRNMLDLDDPDHARLKGLVHKAFTPRLIDNMREQVQTITDDLLDAIERKGEMDLIRDLALPLPVTIIANMLGVPSQDQHKFHRWTSAMLKSTASSWGMVIAIPNLMAFLGYIRKLVKTRQANPQDDLTSALIQAKEANDQMTEDELVAMIFLLLIAGHETTVNLIGNGVLALLENPDQLEKLQADPSLIKTGVEEMLRYYSPVEWSDTRFAREDVTIEGVTIPRGALVHAVLASANRDERQFANPDTLDLAREMNRHVAFGQGIHYCLGSPLARLEGQIAINTLLRRMPDLQLSVPVRALPWRKGIMLRGLESMPVRFARQRATA